MWNAFVRCFSFLAIKDIWYGTIIDKYEQRMCRFLKLYCSWQKECFEFPEINKFKNFMTKYPFYSSDFDAIWCVYEHGISAF